MNRSELESKHISELHTLAAEAGVERYRMLSRAELLDALADGSGGRENRPPRGGGRGREERDSGERRAAERQAAVQQPAAERPGGEREAGPAERPRRRRRRRFRRRGGKTVRAHEMLMPAGQARQALVYAETRQGCTALLRDLAAELSGGRGADPIAVLVDPSPEELADWKREAPKAEIVSAGQERHAEDAMAQAAARADRGEAIVLLIDSLSRAAEEFGGSRIAKELFDAGLSSGGAGGSLTVVAAVERPA
jgi:transcription termination factor Rho